MEQANDSRAGTNVIREDIETRARICTKFYWSVKIALFMQIYSKRPSSKRQNCALSKVMQFMILL